MSDVYLYQSADDGEIDAEQGDVLMTTGLETAVYLSLFGGNFRDDGTANSPNAWWGNLNAETAGERQISRFQNFINGAPATSANLRRAEDKAIADLAWLAETEEVKVVASIPSSNRIKISITIRSDKYEFTEQWATT